MRFGVGVCFWNSQYGIELSISFQSNNFAMFCSTFTEMVHVVLIQFIDGSHVIEGDKPILEAIELELL
jgi:hypothetical protein